MNINELDFEKGDGLIPAIVQDSESFRVLMLGYMNRESLEKTLEGERVTFYSRSREELWTKGETSGNYLELEDIQSDCDNDTLLILARPTGPVCHTGEKSCFFKKDFSPESGGYGFLTRLEKLLKNRRETLPEDSYTASLFRDGLDKIAQKVGEEAVETVIEAKNDNRDAFLDESADLLFHLMVMLVEKEIPMRDIVGRLERRHMP